MEEEERVGGRCVASCARGAKEEEEDERWPSFEAKGVLA